MSFRRVLALAVLLLDAFVATQIAEQAPGVFGLVAYIVATFVAIGAAAVLVFDLPMKRAGPAFVDSGYDLASPVDFGASCLGILLFAAAPFFIAVRGVYRGVLPALGSGPDIAFTVAPGRFLLSLLVFVAWGLGCLFLLRKTWLARRELLQRKRSTTPNREA